MYLFNIAMCKFCNNHYVMILPSSSLAGLAGRKGSSWPDSCEVSPSLSLSSWRTSTAQHPTFTGPVTISVTLDLRLHGVLCILPDCVNLLDMLQCILHMSVAISIFHVFLCLSLCTCLVQ